MFWLRKLWNTILYWNYIYYIMSPVSIMKVFLVLFLWFFAGAVSFTCVAWDFWFGMEHENIKARKDIKIWWVQENQEENILDIVKSVVNRTLWILALIALIVILYGWLLMVISAGDEEKYNKWWTILKTASLWLVFIGLAWFILSLIFWLIVKTSDGVWSADTLG